MKRSTSLASLILAATLSLPAFAIDRDGNPPGPVGGPGSNWENPPGPRGGPGTSPDRRPRLSPEQREKLMSMSPEDRHAMAQKLRERREQRRHDRDGNPPGPVGGPGTGPDRR